MGQPATSSQKLKSSCRRISRPKSGSKWLIFRTATHKARGRTCDGDRSHVSRGRLRGAVRGAVDGSCALAVGSTAPGGRGDGAIRADVGGAIFDYNDSRWRTLGSSVGAASACWIAPFQPRSKNKRVAGIVRGNAAGY